MSRIRGVIPAELADVLAVEGGRINVGELRDGEGISLVYDVSRLAAATLLRHSTRSTIQDNVTDAGLTIAIADPPGFFRLTHIFVGVDDPALVNRASLFARGQGGRDVLIWDWRNGDSNVPAPETMQVAQTSMAGFELLLGTFYGVQANQGFTWIAERTQLGRVGFTALEWRVEAQPAVTFDLRADVHIQHWVGQVAGVGNVDPPLELPSW